MNKRLDEIRRHLGIHKKDFAKELGITQNSYTNYIKGIRPIPIQVVKILGSKYQVSADWLVFGRYNMRYESNTIGNEAEEMRDKLERIKSILQDSPKKNETLKKPETKDTTPPKKEYSEKTIKRLNNEEQCSKEIENNYNTIDVFSDQKVKEYIGVDADAEVMLEDWEKVFYRLSTFSPIHVYIFLHRVYLKDKTLQELADELGYTTGERIRQLESTVYKVFRHPDVKSLIYSQGT